MDIATLEQAYHDKKATLDVNTINHREYIFNGRRYFVGWSSERDQSYKPRTWRDPAYKVRGWFVYKDEPITE